MAGVGPYLKKLKSWQDQVPKPTTINSLTIFEFCLHQYASFYPPRFCIYITLLFVVITVITNCMEYLTNYALASTDEWFAYWMKSWTISDKNVFSRYFFTSLFTTLIPTAGLPATRVSADWLLDFRSAAKWAQHWSFIQLLPIQPLKDLTTMRAEPFSASTYSMLEIKHSDTLL